MGFAGTELRPTRSGLSALHCRLVVSFTLACVSVQCTKVFDKCYKRVLVASSRMVRLLPIRHA